MLSPVVTEVKKIVMGQPSDRRLKSLIHRKIRQIKDLDISPLKVYHSFDFQTFQSYGKLSA
jgi:hypothetical protein